MQKSCRSNGTMAAILGLDDKVIKRHVKVLKEM